MQKTYLSFILTGFFWLIISTNAQAASRLAYENFNDQSWTDGPFVETEGEGTPVYQTGRGGSGYAYSMYVNPNGEPDFAFCFNTPSNLNKLYASFWIKFTNISSGSGSWNDKLFYWYPLNEAQGRGAAVHQYSNGYLVFGTYEGNFAGGVRPADGDWHHAEFYVKEDGTVKIGLDREKHGWSVNETGSRTASWELSNGRICFPSIVAHNTSDWSGWRIVDDLEVWDGIPGIDTTSTGTTSDSGASGSTSGSTTSDTSASAPSGTIVIDNGDPNTDASGRWSPSGASGYYGANSLYSNRSGDTYSFEAARSGAQEVYLWHAASSNRCTNVPIEIYDGNTLLDTITVNQQQNGGQWNLLGTYSFDGNARTITISNAEGDCVTSADAVRFVPTSASSTTNADSNSAPPPPGKPFVMN